MDLFTFLWVASDILDNMFSELFQFSCGWFMAPCVRRFTVLRVVCAAVLLVISKLMIVCGGLPVRMVGYIIELAFFWSFVLL